MYVNQEEEFNPHFCQNLCSNSSPCFPVTKPFPDKTQNFNQLWGFLGVFFGGGDGSELLY